MDPSATDIHAFAIDDPTTAEYVGSGSVAGHLLNQFSMSEHEGVLRVASTTDPTWWQGEQQQPGENRVTTLRLEGGALAEVGRLAGLGVDERIFSVRFIGDLGYVVTFRQIDPLHVLDLSDPAAPRQVGELEVPGYSAYLHPVAPGRLLGVGVDATEDGMRIGVQLSLFDISDPANPTRLQHLTLPQTSTEVEFDHRAFLWWAPTGQAVLPIDTYGETSSTNEAVAFAVGDGGIAESGRTSHFDDVDPGSAWPAIRRGVVVGDTLFTLSAGGVESASLDDLTETGFAAFG
jgi:uncharacterized secreted protein with C-terminal beta-propeller domain